MKNDLEYATYLQHMAAGKGPNTNHVYGPESIVAFNDLKVNRDPRSRADFDAALERMEKGLPEPPPEKKPPLPLQPLLMPLAADWGKSPIASELLRRLEIQIKHAAANMDIRCHECGLAPPNADKTFADQQRGMYEAFGAMRSFLTDCRDGNIIADEQYDAASRVTAPEGSPNAG